MTSEPRVERRATIQAMDLTGLLRDLDARRVSYRLERHRDATMVVVAVPGERWEIEFLDQGGVEIERFRSDGKVEDARALEELWPLTE